MSDGLSGRTLRKIPFLACALYIHLMQSKTEDSLAFYLSAMEQTIKKQFEDRSLMPQQWCKNVPLKLNIKFRERSLNHISARKLAFEKCKL